MKDRTLPQSHFIQCRYCGGRGECCEACNQTGREAIPRQPFEGHERPMLRAAALVSALIVIGYAIIFYMPVAGAAIDRFVK